MIDDDKKFYSNDRFFVSNRNFNTEHVKIVKNSGFSGFLPTLLYASILIS